MAEALGWNAPDGEGRKLGEQRGLDTPVVPAVNYAGWLLGGLRARPVA